MKFGTVIGRALNDIQHAVATDAEIERGEAVIARIRRKDDLIEEFISRGEIVKLIDAQKLQEKTLSNAATSPSVITKIIMQQQRKSLEILSSLA